VIRFVLGALSGAAVVFAITYSKGPEPVRAERGGSPAAQTTPLRASNDAVPGGAAVSADDAGDEAAPAPFPDGEFTIRIGEGYRFGEQGVRAGDDPDADLFCQDLRYDVSLRCPHGAAPVDIPIGVLAMPKTAAELAARVADAPATMGQRDATLLVRPTKRANGVALVLAQDGSTYCLHLVRIFGSPDALKRSATIAYRKVAVREGGGVARLPTATGAPPITKKQVQRYIDVGVTIPGSTFSNFLRGNYRVPDTVEEDLVLTDDAYLAVSQPFDKKITFRSRGALLAAKGIAPEGHVVTRSYSGLISIGDMAGTVDVKSYSHLHITGDLTGVVNIGSYTTLIVDGDILGTVNVRNYTTMLLRGRVIRTIDTKGSCWSTFYFESYHSNADLEALGGQSGRSRCT